ncbi:hypothetical protein RJ639_027409 [Escallonia herrerae]|uniref:Integrase catalytic domain-containing protein n=1 Tax=Escallonia herrerae TaxID=1293975 RepID=A0AA89BKC1_9ASTE|nr:hypothetical protein RJ639_027409 [Escallonia herrerae]
MKNSSALFRIVQGPKESLKSYCTHFNTEKLLINNLNPGVTFVAMARGMKPGTPLQFSLNKRTPENMPDLLDRVKKYLQAEEDSMTTQDEGTSGQKRCDRPKGRIPEEPKRSQATLSEHLTPLTTSREHILNQIKSQNILKWPKPMRMPADKRDAQLYSHFHKDHGHTTEECKVLQPEIENLIAKGHLKQFVKANERQGGRAPAPLQTTCWGGALLVFGHSRLGNYALREVHEGICGQHLGGRALAHKVLRQGYYWPTMQQDAMSYTRKYDACQRFSSIPKQALSLLSTLSSPIPFAMWGMDIFGPPTIAQRKFVIVAIDYFTKWVEAKALDLITERKCEDFFWQAVVCRFGILRVLITDNGKQFDNSTFRTFYANLSIEQRFTSVAHPQTNGQTEVTNRTLLQGIKKKLNGASGLWVDELPKILWAYNTTSWTSTGETPFSLSFGTEALIPVEIGLPSLRLTTYDPVQNEEALRANLDLLNERPEQAAMRLAAYRQRVSKFYDKRVRPRIFRVGDLVLRRIEASSPRDPVGKLAPS